MKICLDTFQHFGPVITKTCQCNVYPLEPHFYIANLKQAGVNLFFLIFAQKHRLRVHVRTASLTEVVLMSTHNLCFGSKYEN